MPKVAILLVNWNGYELTKECVKSLQSITYSNYHIVIVDNGSIDGSYSKLLSLFPDVTIIRSEKNFGFSGGNNIGIRNILTQDYDYILLLNNDTVVDASFLDELVKTAQSNIQIGIVGSKIYYYDKPDILWAAGSSYDLSKAIFLNRGQLTKDIGQYNKEEEVDFINGCCLLIRTDIMKKIGGLDEVYFAYVEDVDLNMQVKKLGYKVYYNPKSIIKHHVSASTGGESNSTKEYLKARNGYIFAYKNLNAEAKKIFFVNYTKDKSREIITNLSHLNFRISFAIAKGILSGYYFLQKQK